MADQEHFKILEQGVTVWNRWRETNVSVYPDLSGVNLSQANLSKANLSNTNFSNADLSRSNLCKANLQRTILSGTNFYRADLSHVDLRDTSLRGNDLRWAILSGANLNGAILHACSIYAISAWNVLLEGTVQSNLVVTNHDEPFITVDDLEVAQFIHLLLNNRKIRNIINTITSKVVLILGRFTPERKVILDTLREELRQHNYSAIIFDFDRPGDRDLTETVSILAHLARFIIADLTDASSVPHELAMITPYCFVPVQPLLMQQETRDRGKEYRMFRDLQRRYHWILPIYRYQSADDLFLSLKKCVLAPAEQKAQELERHKNSSGPWYSEIDAQS
jgi:Pentapeptide repeats (8 copies)